jgi:hypothetical protein
MQFVAFMDVLGFKDMVENCTHEKLERVYKNAFVTNTTYSLAKGKVVPVHTEAGDFVTPDLSNPLTSCLIVSDSVILWTNDASMLSFINIVSTVGKILASGIYTGRPMRGGIALGEFSTIATNAGPNGNVEGARQNGHHESGIFTETRRSKCLAPRNVNLHMNTAPKR